MTAAICDDEKILCDQLEKWIKRQAPDCDLALFTSGEALLREKKDFDIIFLDIRMEGIDGIETAKRLRSRRAETILIFITGVKEHVFEAFDVSAFHYLLKPVDEEKFAEVFARAAAEAEKKKGREEALLFLKSKGRGRVLERNNAWTQSALENGEHVKSMRELLDSYEEQLKELDRQIAQEMARQNREQLEKTQSSKKEKEPKTGQEIERERVSSLVALSSGMSEIETVRSSQTQAEGETRVLERKRDVCLPTRLQLRKRKKYCKRRIWLTFEV